MDHLRLCLLIGFVFISAGSALKQNIRPIIGILSQGSPTSYQKYGQSYIAASYVKYVEAAGARVSPIFVNQTDDYYAKIFSSINGVLFPGGGADVESGYQFGYSGAARVLYEQAVLANKQGDFFPVWGTCLGFEALMVLTAGKDVLRQGIKAHNISLPVNLEPGYYKSRLLNKMTTPPGILKTLATQNSTYNMHNLALTSANFTANAALKSFYRVLSRNHDMNGVEFISTAEAYDYPIYGTQWHPEKNSFEWKVNACHDLSCVQLMQYMANFFVNEARKSQHHFSSQEEENQHLIYNYQPVNLVTSSSFEQGYFFP